MTFWFTTHDGVELLHKPKEIECGTSACLAGWCVLLGKGGEDRTANSFARDWLEIEEEEAYWMFQGLWSDKPIEHITKLDALAYLDDCIEAGAVLDDEGEPVLEQAGDIF